MSLSCKRACFGIPAKSVVYGVFFFTGEHADYHQPTDREDKIDYQKLERIARTVLATTWTIADMPSRPVADRPWPDKLKLPR